MKLRNKALIGLFFVVLCSCAEQPFYEKSYSFESREWAQDVKPEFSVDFSNVEVPYDFTLSLRTSTDYKYNNLWIFMKTESPENGSERKPYELKITNPDGSWVGEKSGSMVTTTLYFRRIKMPKEGTYTFLLEQGITESIVDEVHDLTLRIDAVKEE